MMRPTNILLTNHYNFMQKEQIIRSVSEAVFFDSQEIRLDRESKNFGENVEKIDPLSFRQHHLKRTRPHRLRRQSQITAPAG